MTTVNEQTRPDANKAALLRALAPIKAALERHLAPASAATAPSGKQPSVNAVAEQPGAIESALHTLCSEFSLSAFERDLLLMCAGPELDASFAELYAAVHGDSRFRQPTFSLALAVLDSAQWSALTPQAPLRFWRMIEVNAGQSLTTSALRIDERILHFLTGVNYLDERLATAIEPLKAHENLVPTHQHLVTEIQAQWAADDKRMPVIELCASHTDGAEAVAARACAALGLAPYRIAAGAIPTSASERNALVRLWGRECRLDKNALLVDVTMDSETLSPAISAFLGSVGGPCFLISATPTRCDCVPVLSLPVRKPLRHEQDEIWETSLGAIGWTFDQPLRSAASQFDLHADDIHAVVRRLGIAREPQGHAAASEPATREAADLEPAARLVQASRTQARPRMDDVAQRIESLATRADLVLPDPQKGLLDDIVAHVRQRHKVYEQWGFSNKSTRGLGISALFAGASGTGKTMAAEVLANRLALELYRIDLSGVVSKYIGETAKNLRRVFDAAEDANVILLFDEADALFGKRSEVKDSHDRYANIEVSYLLQRMEAYRGLAILTTNMKEALDSAFLRRIRFIVRFPFPNAEQRFRIWQTVFPPDTPKRGLDFEKLAQLNLVGGNIRNIAMHAAFNAADRDQPVGMQHVNHAALVEYAKLEKTPTAAEMRAWA